jgi:1,4-dihydroxy-6-naphthoate synthase
MTPFTEPEPLRIAYSPCPNDTFVFDAWAHGRVPGAPALDVTFADIDITNGMAERGELDVLKVSYAVLPYVLDEYALLPCGGALGRGCGPLVLTRGAGVDLTGRTVAVPSERSTAYLLFRLWAADTIPGGVGEIVVMPFHEIMPAVRDGKVDAGLVIHEARFTYQNYGLHKLADMGEHWEATTGLPIPLGAIIAKRSLGADALNLLADSVRVVRPRRLGRPRGLPPVRHGTRPGDGPVRRRPAHRAVRQRVHGGSGGRRVRGDPGVADARGGGGAGAGTRTGRAHVSLSFPVALNRGAVPGAPPDPHRP